MLEGLRVKARINNASRYPNSVYLEFIFAGVSINTLPDSTVMEELVKHIGEEFEFELVKQPSTEPSTKPQPGQWWFSENMSSRIYAVGYDEHEYLVWHFRNEEYGTLDSDQFKGYHHEPECTGWNWTKPKPSVESKAIDYEKEYQILARKVRELESQVHQLNLRTAQYFGIKLQ